MLSSLPCLPPPWQKGLGVLPAGDRVPCSAWEHRQGPKRRLYLGEVKSILQMMGTDLAEG